MAYSRVIRWFLLILGILGCQRTTQETGSVTITTHYPPEQQPKNIVLLIGDGMGVAQVTAALYSNSNRLALEKFPVIGFHKAYSYDDLITDSAAGATAFACGVKTYNGAVGLNADSLPCRTILEEAHERKLATGMVVTSSLVNATPAAFIAHQPLRIFYDQIAADFLQTNVDLLIGGGKRYFDRREIDERNLYEELKQKGYLVYDYMNYELNQIEFNAKKKLVYFTADTDPVSYMSGRDYLPLATKQALQFLDKRSDKGFFLMVEGSQIDWAGHAKRGDLLVSEMLDFDRTVAVVLDFARRHGNTLVIVTGDHETGGLSINEGSKMNKLKLAFTSNAHTGTLVPVFAYGPQAHLFSGIYENTDIYHKMRQALDFSDSTSAASFMQK